MGKLIVTPVYVLRILGALTVFLVSLSFTLQVVKFRTSHPHLTRVINFFDVEREQNLPTFYSALLLFVAGLLLALIATIKRQGREKFVAHWTGLAIGFFYIATDDMLTLHERFDDWMRGAVKLQLPQFLYFARVIPATVVVLGLAFVYRNFILALPRRAQVLFVLSGGIYIFGALGMEMVGGAIYAAQGESPDSLLYSIATTVEEGSEMGGVVLFIYALLDYLAICYGHLEVRLR
jgi:hypothetical protein